MFVSDKVTRFTQMIIVKKSALLHHLLSSVNRLVEAKTIPRMAEHTRSLNQ
uniref:AlNc14C237G9413 protein n=1 Tax=Albugo laibachii Nc14 TaxID=890382 RepID=F0WF11_9STRA|nr:AlNc14C79G5205 [Albugo laibachii Nc14]CCA24395.1 AlNc14C237G9413 [Albugo laibachii Nc14]|eukprot:CCA24395.1 AlNc14C237G9413 [Albugo laibachii Nc14]